MNSFELNKIAGAVLLAGIIAMGAGQLSRGLVPEHGGHGATAGAHAPAAAPSKPAEPLAPVSPLLASADAEAGGVVARKCTQCHTFEKGGPNKVGPNLWGVMGGHKAHLDSFAYSNALKNAGGEWTYEDLNKFIHKPSAFLPGTKMSFAGLNSVQDRANVIAFLRSQTDNAPPLPTAEEVEAAKKAAEAKAPAAAPAHGAAPAGKQAGAAPAAGGGSDAVESIGPLLASASVEDGKAVARKCAACHTFEKGGPNKVGPNLYGIVGADKAHLEGFAYSKAMASAPGNWTYDELNKYLHKPAAVVPGTKMSFAGLSSTKDRASVIAYLRSMSDSPVPLPEAGGAAKPAAAAAATAPAATPAPAAKPEVPSQAAPATAPSGGAAPAQNTTPSGTGTPMEIAPTTPGAGAPSSAAPASAPQPAAKSP